MKKNFVEECGEKIGGCKDAGCGAGGAVYGLGMLGALVYFVTTAPTLVDAIIGIFKAILWPAFLVFSALKFLGI